MCEKAAIFQLDFILLSHQVGNCRSSKGAYVSAFMIPVFWSLGKNIVLQPML